MSSTFASSAFAEADERAFDRAVRRLPGFWTWDYVESGSDDTHVVVSPPWSPATEAFRVIWDAQFYNLEGALDRAGDGPYPSIEDLARVIRAVVMGDPITPSAPDAKPDREPRLTAKGRPAVAPDPNELTDADCETIDEIVGAWHDANWCALSNASGSPGCLYASWDDRFPAFVIERQGAGIWLKDNLTFGILWGARGTFSNVRSALGAVWCVMNGDFSSEDPEVKALFDAYRAAMCAARNDDDVAEVAA